MSSDYFYSGIKFYDDKNFPYQFSRSGDFSLAEAELLTNCGYIMQQLEKRTILPENEAQNHFIDVLNGQTKPLYKSEYVYLKYLKLIQKKESVIQTIKITKGFVAEYEEHPEYV